MTRSMKSATAAWRASTALRARLDRVYAGRADDDPIDRAFAAVVERHAIPRALPEALLAGMEMDARGTRYGDDDELLVYCFRVAATVGLMMTRVMGASDDVAYVRAADLGVAMQLTNIARDVGEDARRGRVYLPAQLLDGASRGDRRAAVRAILARADARTIARPIAACRCCRAIAASRSRSARNIYSAIGDAIAKKRLRLDVAARVRVAAAQAVAGGARAAGALLDGGRRAAAPRAGRRGAPRADRAR